MKSVNAIFPPPLNDLFTKFQPRQKSIPWFILGISILAFGLLIPWLGFYQDDWHPIYYWTHEGVDGLRRFFFFDSRPFAFIVLEPLFHLLGISPLGWHVGILLLRFFTAFCFLEILNLLWPNSTKSNLLVATLFLVYPAFLLQPMSLIYSLHWSMYLVYMLSLWLMLLAARRPRFFLPLTVFALLLQVLHLLVIEYFVGLELLRPILLLLVISQSSDLHNRIKAVLKAWSPYLLVASIYVVFRISFGKLFGYDRNTPTILFDLFTQPLHTLSSLIQTGLQDFVSILLSAWYGTLDPTLFDLNRPSNFLIWAIVLFCLAGCWLYFVRFHVGKTSDNRQSLAGWAKWMILVGFLTVLVGLLPGWAIGKTVYSSNPLWSGRFALAAMPGAAMMWAGVIYVMINSPIRRDFVFSLLVALAVGTNLRTAVDYKNSWEKQLKFYWQLTWRAPYIEPGTAFISDSEFLYFMGNYPTSFAINTLYPKFTKPPDIGYWLYTNGEYIPDWSDFRQGSTLSFVKYASTFTGLSTNSLALDFEPEKSQCLWILRPIDSANRNLTLLALEFVPASNIDRIRLAAPVAWSPPEAIFGKEPAHSWCYYFEQADLARQNSDWSKAIHLWETAQASGLSPDSGVEYTPFIDAYAHTGDWNMAGQLTLRANRITEHMDSLLCATWKTILKDTTSTPDREQVMLALQSKLQCELP